MKVLIACLCCIAALQGCAASDVGKPSESAVQASGYIDTWYDGGVDEHDHYHDHDHASGGGRGGR